MRVFTSLAAAVLFVACGSRPGSVRVTITFENEAQTRCVRVTVKTPSGSVVNAVPTSLRRDDDQLLVGIGETPELVGELEVTVSRFTQADCTGTSFAAESQRVTLASGQDSAVEFVFRGAGSGDGGVDAGTGPSDAGADAGCEVSSCPAPGECQVQATACLSPGQCAYEPRTPGTACDGGVCGGGECRGNPCDVLAAGSACDDNLTCTSSSTCSGGVCTPVQCAMTPPVCTRLRQPIIACDAMNPTLCQVEADPAQEGTSCSSGAGRCLGGECRPWLPTGFAPRFFDLPVSQVPYPSEPWALSSPDGGACAVVLNTGPADPPFIEDGGCGLPPVITARATPDGGLALFTMTGLSVGAGVEVHFTGTRPAQLLVLGDATVDGLVSVAPQLLGGRPAGAHPPECLDAGVGVGDDRGGGGGGFGAVGGQGAASGGAGGGATPSAAVLRGGCGGAPGNDSAGLAVGGAGGGAIDLIVTGTLTVRNSGAVTASGGGGGAPVGDKRGGGGGGSGGMVVLEADVLRIVDGGAVTANGGGGGEGGKNGETSAPGPFGSFSSDQRVANPGTSPGGGNGGRGGAGTGGSASGEVGLVGTGSGNPGGGGGGGGVGVIYLKARTSCTRVGGVLSGGQPEAIACP